MEILSLIGKRALSWFIERKIILWQCAVYKESIEVPWRWLFCPSWEKTMFQITNLNEGQWEDTYFKGNFRPTCHWSFCVVSVAAIDIAIEQTPWWQSSLRDNLLSVVRSEFNKPLNNLCISVCLKNNQQFRAYCPCLQHCSKEKINLCLLNLVWSKSNLLWTTVLKAL